MCGTGVERSGRGIVEEIILGIKMYSERGKNEFGGCLK